MAYTLTLSNHEVHVWQADLDDAAQDLSCLRDTLSAEERERAARFHFAQDRDRWTAGRGLLRVLLSRYLCAEPQSLRFAYGAYGKPVLAGGESEPVFCFNLSHSERMALVAIARGREVGVDIERIRTDFRPEDLAPAVFSPQEQEALRAIAVEDQHRLFFEFWTAKEAYIKARGSGFSFPVQQLTVSLTAGSDAISTRTEVAAEAAEEGCPALSLRRLHPKEGYLAAVAAAGEGWQLRFCSAFFPER